jgi:hypothetical protein
MSGWKTTCDKALSIDGVLCGLQFLLSKCGTIWDRSGQLGESGEYQMGRVRVVCFHVRSSKGGSPHLCQLRATSFGPWGTSIDYVLAHTGFMGSCKLSSFDGHRVGRCLTSLTDVHWDSVWATHGGPTRLYHERHAIGWGRTQPDSLIVNAKGGHSWCLHGLRVSCCQVISLARCIFIQISTTPSDMGEACSLCSNTVRNLIVDMRIMRMTLTSLYSRLDSNQLFDCVTFACLA